MFSSMLDASQQQKVALLGSDYKEVLGKLIDKEFLEQKYGGNHPNKTSNFFPPDLTPKGG